LCSPTLESKNDSRMGHPNDGCHSNRKHPKRAAERALNSERKPEKHPSGAKARVDSAGFAACDPDRDPEGAPVPRCPGTPVVPCYKTLDLLRWDEFFRSL
jgi:hypothetical protein